MLEFRYRRFLLLIDRHSLLVVLAFFSRLLGLW